MAGWDKPFPSGVMIPAHIAKSWARLEEALPKVLETLEANVDSGAWQDHNEIREFMDACEDVGLLAPGTTANYFSQEG
jgi:hypothetical protein